MPGDRRAWFQLGRAYRNVKQDEKAVEAYRKADELGSAMGAFALGIMYRDGAGLPKDLFQSRRHFAAAAERGLALALSSLAVIWSSAGAVR